ncbi:MAG: ABC transporter permease, partial [Propionibacterium sp.]
EIEKISGATTHRMKIAYTLVGKDYRGVMGLDEGAFNKVLAQELVEGSFPKGENEALINELWVDDFDGIGSEVTVNNPKGPKHNLKIVGVFKNSSGMRSGLFMVNPKTFAKLNPLNTDLLVTLEIKPDGDLEKVRSEIEKIIEEEPTLTVTNNDEFVQLQLNQLNQVLWLVYGLLGLALIISILGIVNTLVLAVIERTREIGLMRAIGLTRSQLRRTIRLEAIMITVLGSVVGIGLGLFFGIVIRAALRNDGLTELEIPVVQLVIFLVVTAFIGMLAATWPARRAAKQNILAAIATE